MDIEEECVVSGAMAWLLRLEAIAGCISLKLQPLGTNYYIARITKPKYRLTPIFLFILTFSVIFSFILLNKNINGDDIIQVTENKSLKFLFLDFMTKLFITTVLKLGELRRMKRFIQYYNSIQCVHKTLNKVHKRNKYNQTSTKNYENSLKIILKWFMILYFGWHVMILILTFIKRLEEFSVLLTYMYIVQILTEMYIVLITAQIMLMITFAYSILLQLNHVLAEFLSALDRTDNFNSLEVWKCFDIFYELSHSYTFILETIRKMKRNEGCGFLLLLSNGAVNILILGYGALLFITDDSGNSLYANRSTKLLTWVFVLTMILYLIIDSCHHTQQAIKDAKVIVATLICKMSSSYTFSHDLKHFSKQLLFKPAAYSVFNIFTINRSLLTKILVIIVTNLVAVIQM